MLPLPACEGISVSSCKQDSLEHGTPPGECDRSAFPNLNCLDFEVTRRPRISCGFRISSVSRGEDSTAMETLVGQKRTRDEALEALVGDYVPLGKRPCEKLDERNILAPSSDSEEIPCLSSTGELSSKAVIPGDEDVTESKASMAETLRSLEEELGVSDDQTDDFLMPPSTIEELSGSGLVSSWGDVMWSADVGLGSVHDVILSGEVGCSSENNPGRSDYLSSENSSVLVEGDNCDTNAKTSTSQKNEKFNPVDIGFLIEASDDELGIPPSPTSEKDQSSEHEQETLLSDNSVENSFTSTEVDAAGNLQDAVSWALEGGGDNMGFSDSGIDDWMMGNLDFMMDGQSVYSTAPPLVEAGIVL